MLFAGLVQFALITQPHNILASTRHGSSYLSYTGASMGGQLLFAGSVGAAWLLASGMATFVHGQLGVLLLLAAPTAVAWQIQEYFRRVLYTEERFGLVLATDLISYGGQAAMIVTLAVAQALSAFTALAAIAVSSGLASLLAAWWLRPSLRMGISFRSLGETWGFGRWLLTVPIYWMSTQFYLYVAAAVLGLPVAGALKAAQVLMGPLNLLLAPFESAVPIRLARSLAAEGDSHMNRLVLRTMRLTAPPVAAYCLAAAVFARPLLHLFYGDRYVRYDYVLRFLAAFYFFHFVGAVLSAGLRARRQTKEVFLGYFYASLVALACTVLIPIIRTPAAVAGIILASATLTALLWRAYSLPRATRAAPAPARTGP